VHIVQRSQEYEHSGLYSILTEVSGNFPIDFTGDQDFILCVCRLLASCRGRKYKKNKPKNRETKIYFLVIQKWSIKIVAILLEGKKSKEKKSLL